MKKPLIIGIIIGVLLLIVIALVIALLLLPKSKEKKIENITHLYFTYTSGYAIDSYATYTLDCNDECILKVKQLGDKEEETIEVEIPKEKLSVIQSKLNEYHVSRWNGFHKSDRNVLDGDSFSLNIRINQDESIEASGYMMWPNNYREVKTYLDTTLGSLYKTE